MSNFAQKDRFNIPLIEEVLIDPIRKGADKLIVISGYATHNMASWHIKQIKELRLPPVSINLVVGMCPSDGLRNDVHEGIKSLVSLDDKSYSAFSCHYVCQGGAVHSKLYIWLIGDSPIEAYAGSANYTQSGFSASRREYVVPCNPLQAYEYYQKLERDTIVCNHNEIEEYIILTNSRPTAKPYHKEDQNTQELDMVRLSLLTSYGDVGHGSGINWGHRRDGTKRELNQAYLSLPINIARAGFFPLQKKHFSVLTDDNKQLILRVEQENDKAITTPLNNSHIGEYLRSRIGVPNGAFVTKQDLLAYGRTDVTFYKIDDEQYYMDFSV